MLFVSVTPLQNEITKLYESYVGFKGYSAKRNGFLLRSIESLANPYISILQTSGGLRGMKVCDIGCSTGTFLDLVNDRDAVPFGIDVDREALAVLGTKRIHGVAHLRELSLRMDVICLLQVLEHLLTPTEMIADVANALERDGRVLISVPNAGEVQRLGEHWVGFRVDLEHLNYFDLRTLSQLLSKHGLYVEQHWEHTQPQVKRVTGSDDHVRVNTRRMRVRVESLLRRLLGGSMETSGTFVLTALARKA
jgi:SAM-dependent methyltransferase